MPANELRQRKGARVGADPASATTTEEVVNMAVVRDLAEKGRRQLYDGAERKSLQPEGASKRSKRGR